MAKPITPQEASALKKDMIPDAVIEAFNACIARHFDGHSSTFSRDEVRLKILDAMHIQKAPPEMGSWLDVEALYKEAGWDVELDTPGYNETYLARYTFTRRSWP